MEFKRFIRNQKAVHTTIFFENEDEFKLLISGLENSKEFYKDDEYYVETIQKIINDLNRYYTPDNKWENGEITSVLWNDYMPFLVNFFCSQIAYSPLYR